MNLPACARLPTFPETRTWYRAIQPQFYQTSLDTAQTRSIPSRFSAGPASNPPFDLLVVFPTKLQANSLVRFHDPVTGQPDLLLPKP